ncbi:YTH domain-containing protein 1 isoform X1 [Hydra vulgaris]|uniref:YTH domain-containing protein 1 isoform X1 n=1 Tax=Hydra vulgaris TaxID=6087 RepID=UPI0032E9F687
MHKMEDTENGVVQALVKQKVEDMLTDVLKDDLNTVLSPDDGEIEPGEVPSIEGISDKVVNVLDDILKPDIGQDAFQKELEDSATNEVENPLKNKKSSKSTKNPPKRKLSTRKSKTPSKTAKIEEPREKVEILNIDTNHVAEKSALKSEKSAPKSKIIKTTTSETPLVLPNPDNSLKSNKFMKQSKSELKSVTKPSKSSNRHSHKEPTKSDSKSESKLKSTYKPSKESQTLSSAIEVKINKPDAIKKSKSSTKKEKDSSKKDKKLESKISGESDIIIQKEMLEKKVKELEKKVSKPLLNDMDKPKSKDKSSKSSEKKHVHSEGKDSKRRIKDSKIKNEKKEEYVKVKEKVLSDYVQHMKVVDEIDGGKHSDHESNFSHASSFSQSFSNSRSNSFSDSFSCSFSGSISMSSFTGSNSSLDSIGKISSDKKSRKRIKDSEEDNVQAHKSFIDSMLKGARYFIIKSNNHENVTLSKAKGVWSTPPANERKLNDAYRHSTNVILIFSVKESGRFQGFARLASESNHNQPAIPWVLPQGFDRKILSGTFKVDWLNRREVAFSHCLNLRNPWNENKEVKICRDGQEVEPSVGEVLCRMFEDDFTIDLSRIARHLKQKKSSSDTNHNREHSDPPRFRGSSRGGWRGGFQGNIRSENSSRDRRSSFFRRSPTGFRGRGKFETDRDRSYYKYDRYTRENSRSRSYDARRSARDSRDRRHRDKVKEFLKNDRSKFGVRKETLLNGSYSDYVREFQRHKQMRGVDSSSYAHTSNYPVSSGRPAQYDPTRVAAEEFLRHASHRR